MKGYAAITTILIVGAITVMIAITAGLNSIGEGQMSVGGYKKEKAQNMVDSCAEEVLIELNENNFIPENVSLAEGECNVKLELNSGTNWIFSIGTTTSDNYQKRILIDCTRGEKIKVNKWTEL